MIHPLIDQNRDEIRWLCEMYHVRRLDLFGSATRERFDPAHSDRDFVVTFKELPQGKRADAYFGLLDALADLFDRPVDLIVESAVSNPYFREEMQRNKEPLYAT